MPIELSKVLPDEKKSNQGVWVKFQKWEDAEFLIANSKTKNYRFFAAGKMRPDPTKNEKEYNTEQALNMSIDTMAEKVLLGWKGIQLDGKEFVYSVENAKWLLNQAMDLYDFIVEQSNNQENFRKEMETAATANLKSDPTVEPAVEQQS